MRLTIRFDSKYAAAAANGDAAVSYMRCVVRCSGWRLNRLKLDDSMRMETRFDSKYAAAAANGDAAVSYMRWRCAVLWLAEQVELDDSMRMEIRFDSKYAVAAANGDAAVLVEHWAGTQAQASLALCEWERFWERWYDPCSGTKWLTRWLRPP